MNVRRNARRNTRRLARSVRGWLLTAALVALAGGVSACGVTDNETLPSEVPDPADVQTAAGALARYHGAIDSLPRTFGFIVRDGNAVPTDELTALLVLGVSDNIGLDSRQELEVAGDNLYRALHKLRGQAREARGVLAAYAPESPAALRGQLYVEEAYAEVFLADLFCSGIPLSTVDFGADYTLDTARSTKGVYQHAVALFDSALALTGDSLAWQYLATVGKGRALLGLDSVSAAVAAVIAVPDNYQYQVQTATATGTTLGWFWTASTASHESRVTVGDHEGLKGLDFRSSGDPRTPAHAMTFVDQPGNVYTAYLPDTLRYPLQGAATFTLANGVEARLIEAEGALRAGDAAAWRDKLNGLRTDGTQSPGSTLYDTLGVTGCGPTADLWCGPDGVSGGTFRLPPGATLTSSVELNPMPDELAQYCRQMSYYAPCSESPAHTTVRVYDVPPQWRAGAGGVNGLAPLEDPGSDAARVDLLFRERAFWLYLTGHRLGDLRRLVRQYNRSPTAVFPTGPYLYVAGFTSYGQEIVFPVPETERTYNPKYTGCINRNA